MAVNLVLLDVVMPGQGGPETWEQLRSLRPGLRVLFSSGYADDRYRQLAALIPRRAFLHRSSVKTGWRSAVGA